jgi:16S rRNA (cytosine967-C5)-methyltransferase
MFRDWLGPRGTRPPPLDRFLAARRPAGPDVAALDRLVRRVVALVRAPAPGGSALLDQVRALPDAALAAAARPPLPDAVAAARATAHTWPGRCAAHGIPPGFGPLLARRAERWGDAATLAWLARQDTRPPLWIRLRDPAAVDALRARGFTVDGEGPARRVSGPGDPRVVMRDGGFEIQDLGSQQVAALAALRPGGRAWDVCAGRGGKTMALADALAGRGAVVATDVDEKKLAELKVRARRAGVADVVRVRAWDGERTPDFGPEARKGFDVVFVDAPCSASGTWRRNPDARLRTDPAEVPGFADLQRRLLELAATRVAPGGRLVYATCSVFVEEDEALSPGARFVPAGAGLYGAPEADADTLFGAVFVRAP